MSDKERIPELVSYASDGPRLQGAQHTAARRLLEYDGEVYPHDGCAITLAVLMQAAKINSPDIFQAIELARYLETERGWDRVALGEQRVGDVGTTCGKKPLHGEDHIYLVLKVDNKDEMVIADNQEPKPHFRYVSGKGGKTPTRYFLRAAE